MDAIDILVITFGVVLLANVADRMVTRRGPLMCVLSGRFSYVPLLLFFPVSIGCLARVFPPETIGWVMYPFFTPWMVASIWLRHSQPRVGGLIR